jgi:transposase
MIRKILRRNGYKWLPRCQKRKYSAAVMRARLAFAEGVLALTPRQFRDRLSLAMDGVVLTVPPPDATERANYCRYGDTHMWRRPDEGNAPRLAGADPYGKQVPISRAVPLWGGISQGGFSAVVWHDSKKLSASEWACAVNDGKLSAAIQRLQPARAAGRRWVLCDNESFLRAPASRDAHRAAGVQLWAIPPRSPDLNPIEKFWGWLRKQLRARDFADLRAGRPAVGKAAFRERAKRLLQSAKAQKVAAACAGGLRSVCKDVVRVRGAATRG